MLRVRFANYYTYASPADSSTSTRTLLSVSFTITVTSPSSLFASADRRQRHAQQIRRCKLFHLAHCTRPPRELAIETQADTHHSGYLIAFTSPASLISHLARRTSLSLLFASLSAVSWHTADLNFHCVTQKWSWNAVVTVIILISIWIFWFLRATELASPAVIIPRNTVICKKTTVCL